MSVAVFVPMRRLGHVEALASENTRIVEDLCGDIGQNVLLGCRAVAREREAI